MAPFRHVAASAATFAAIIATAQSDRSVTMDSMRVQASGSPFAITDGGIFLYHNDGNLVVVSTAEGNPVVWQSGDGGVDCNSKACYLQFFGNLSWCQAEDSDCNIGEVGGHDNFYDNVFTSTLPGHEGSATKIVFNSEDPWITMYDDNGELRAKTIYTDGYPWEVYDVNGGQSGPPAGSNPQPPPTNGPEPPPTEPPEKKRNEAEDVVAPPQPSTAAAPQKRYQLKPRF